MELGDHIKGEEMDPDESESSDWFGYACKSEEILFYYNIKTGERRWATNFSVSEKTILKVRTSDVPPKPKEVRSVATQTEDPGCVNQCTSMYVDNEQQNENRASSRSTNSNSNEIIEARIVVVEQNLSNNPAIIVDEPDEVRKKFEPDESLSALITDMKRKQELQLVQNGQPDPESGPNVYSCPFCPRKFRQKSYVEIHIRTHTGEKPFQCSYCDKAFTRKNNLIVHLRTHTGERPYECSYCDKAFSQKNNLNEHLRIHTGEKRHKCPYCEKAFTGKGTLNTHLRIHTGERPHKCLYCEKAFSWKGDLDRHLGTHTGKKPFGCFYCVKDFITRTELKMHLRTHTGEKPFKCSYCQKAFTNKSNLNVHLRSRHSSAQEKPFDEALAMTEGI